MYSDRFKRLTPYVPGEQPKDGKFIKLNTNETPYPPCPEIKELLQRIEIEELRLYPDPQSVELREAIGKVEEVPASRIFVSNGSDEALSFCFFAFFDGSTGPVLFPDVSYSFYPVYCAYYELPFKEVPLQSDFSLDFEAVETALPASAGFIFPNPNAPTGRFEELSSVERLVRKAAPEKAVIIDEAYIDFGGDSAVSLINAYPNLVVVKTMSKGFSLAGIRLGYGIGSEEAADALFTVKDSFNSYPVDRIAQRIGIAAMNNTEYYKEIQEKIISTRESCRKELEKLGWKVLPSKANFLFAGHPDIRGEKLAGVFRENGILVRHFRKSGIEDFIRITVGTDEEMEELLHICKTVL